MDRGRISSSYRQSSSYASLNSITPLSRPYTARQPAGNSFLSRPETRHRARTVASSIGGIGAQQILCAVSESRGVSPTVGLAFVNLATNEVVLSQIKDGQMYTRTIHKLQVFEPSEVLIMTTAAQSSSKMLPILHEIFEQDQLILLDRKYWSESAGLEYIQRLAFADDVEPIKIAMAGNYFATCCFAAVNL
jgi:DNA mismatch repair protein MSH4